MNSVDKAKIRTCALLYLHKHKKATSRQLYEFISSQKIPFMGEGASTQTVARILRESGKSWRFECNKNNTGRFVWSIRGE